MRGLITAAALYLVLAGYPPAEAFAPNRAIGAASPTTTTSMSSTDVETEIDVRTGKQLGIAFLPEETVERAKVGSPIEKQKLAKDPTSAFVDVYEYARKIREGEMTWEDVEKADLDTVCSS